MEATIVWIPDKANAWVLAEVLKSEADEVEVRILPDQGVAQAEGEADGMLRTVPADDVHMQNHLCEQGIDDMCNLNYLHEASILHNIRKRFFSALPYTYTGEICIAVNPYRWLDMYDVSRRTDYQERPRDELPPHP